MSDDDEEKEDITDKDEKRKLKSWIKIIEQEKCKKKTTGKIKVGKGKEKI